MASYSGSIFHVFTMVVRLRFTDIIFILGNCDLGLRVWLASLRKFRSDYDLSIIPIFLDHGSTVKLSISVIGYIFWTILD